MKEMQSFEFEIWLNAVIWKNAFSSWRCHRKSHLLNVQCCRSQRMWNSSLYWQQSAKCWRNTRSVLSRFALLIQPNYLFFHSTEVFYYKYAIVSEKRWYFQCMRLFALSCVSRIVNRIQEELVLHSLIISYSYISKDLYQDFLVLVHQGFQ